MKKFQKILLFFLICFIFTVVQSNAQKPGSKAQDFKLTGIDDASHRLSDFTGKVVILHFWKSN